MYLLTRRRRDRSHLPTSRGRLTGENPGRDASPGGGRSASEAPCYSGRRLQRRTDLGRRQTTADGGVESAPPRGRPGSASGRSGTTYEALDGKSGITAIRAARCDVTASPPGLSRAGAPLLPGETRSVFRDTWASRASGRTSFRSQLSRLGREYAENPRRQGIR